MRTENRPYQTSHPWLRFSLSLERAPYDLWMCLGAIQSKCEHVANALLPPKVAKNMLHLFLAKGIHATTAIEGNTLSEREVRAVMRDESALVAPSKRYQVQEIKNIVQASNEIANDIIEGDGDGRLTIEQIKRFNLLVLQSLPLDDDVVPGEIRRHSVGVADYRGAPAADCEFLLGRMCEWINSIEPPLPDKGVAFAVLKAVLAHLYLAWIHPFGDGNGRTARLIEVQILLGSRVPMVAAHLLSNHYNKTRPEYYRQLSRASKSGGDPTPFLQYAAQGLFDGLNDQISKLRKHQKELTWRDYIYSSYRDDESLPAARQRKIALALGEEGKGRFVHSNKIRHLTPELAELYANKTDKTISRDLNGLRKKQLVARSGKMVRARTELLQSFSPRRKKGEENAHGRRLSE